MQVFSTVDKLCDQYPNITVALGTFDGVHIGHQKIIGRAVALAKAIQGTSVVFTFSNHPLSIVDPQRCPAQLISNEYKAELMQELGVDVLLNIPFTFELLKYSAAEFIHLLKMNLTPKHIVIGPNYSFGYKCAGNPALLAEAGLKENFEVEVHPAVLMDGDIVSSTLIRKFIAEGNVSAGARLLGRNFRIKGQVITGDQRGRILGFPTANLALPDKFAVPNNGVYAVKTYYDHHVYPSIANIGINPTFNGTNRHIEVHLLNFSGDLYHQFIEIEFLEKLRSEKTFPGVHELIEQIKTDIQAAQSYY